MHLHDRTRAVVPIGVSAWSGPSATITTAAAPPDPPVLSRVPQSDVGYSTVALQWTRGSNNGNPVLSYDIQYRVVGKTEWFEVRQWHLCEGGQYSRRICVFRGPMVQAVKGLSAILDGGVREVQTVSSRTDIGHPITRGSFTLSFGEVAILPAVFDSAPCFEVIESVCVDRASPQAMKISHPPPNQSRGMPLLVT